MSAQFTKFLEERYTRPVVVVTASPAAERSSNKNGLDVVHLLRPFSVHDGTAYAHIGERSENYAVRHFGVRLVRPTCVREAGEDEIYRYLIRSLKTTAPMDLAYGEQLDRSVQELMTPPASAATQVSAGGPLPRPVRLTSSNALTGLLDRSHPAWHSRFMKDISFLTRCAPFDTLDHPIGIISVASTAEAGGIEGCLQVLQTQVRLAAEVRAGLHSMDSEMHKYFILLHDVTDPASPSNEVARDMLRAAQQRFSSNSVALVRINSVDNPRDHKCMDPSPFMEANQPCYDVPSAAAARQYEEEQQAAATASEPVESNASLTSLVSTSTTMIGSVPNSRYLRYHGVHGHFGRWDNQTPKVTGCCLSPQDIQELRTTMNYYLTQALLRHVERRLRAMDIVVEEKRTTTLGRVAAWLKGKDEAKPIMKDIIVVKSGDTVTTMYLATSLEVLMRRCADLSLALHDFSNAARYLKLCIHELFETMADRPYNIPYIAACQEAIAVCHYFDGKLALPSAMPWSVGRSHPKVRSDSSVCRLELALNDYDSGKAPNYVIRTALLLYEYGRSRTPPCNAASKAIAEHLLRGGWLRQNKLYRALIYDTLASLSIFMNPPYPSNLPTPVTLPLDYSVETSVRTYVRRLIEGAGLYRECGASEASLRCYLRVQEVLRGVGQRGSWKYLYEHVLTTTADLYFALREDRKGLTILTACLVLGTPRYRSSEARRHLEYFMEQQQRVLKLMGYGLCPHMPLPLIDRPSFTIDRNVYMTDSETGQAESLVGEVAAEEEWDCMEELTRKYYQTNVMKRYPAVTFPPYHSDHARLNYIFGGNRTNKTQRKALRVTKETNERSYTIAKTEPLLLSFTFRNTVAAPITAKGVCILYLSRNSPETLWKSSASQTVDLPPLGVQRITLPFDPLDEGDYVVIGLCWQVKGLSGYYYFATKESRPGYTESIFENAVENPSPRIDAEENISVKVTHPQAYLTSTLDPPLPAVMRDGEYFHTRLMVTNHSKVNAATHITVQRSPKSAHLLWWKEHALEENLKGEGTCLLAEQLAPTATLEVPLVFRAQHHRGDRTQVCHNHCFLLLAYLPVPSIHLVSPATGATPQVRLHRFLRQVRVQPMLALYSTVLPPSNVSLAMAAVMTTKYIPEKGSAPVRLCRLIATHDAQWGVRCAYTGSLLGKEGDPNNCMVTAENSLTVPLLVNRLPKLEEDTAAAGLTDEGCLLPEVILPDRATELRERLGDTVNGNDMNLYFLQTSLKGAGTVGESLQADMGLAFYLDKAQANQLTEEERKEAERQQERKAFGAIREQYSPIAMTVGWSLVAEDGTMHCGQLFHFIDPMCFLGQRLTAARRSGGTHTTNDSMANNSVTSPSNSFVGKNESNLSNGVRVLGVGEEEEGYQIATTELQSTSAMQEMLKTKFLNTQSANPLVGALLYVACVQPEVRTTESTPYCPTAALSVRCLSLSPLPMLITVQAMTPENNLLVEGTAPLVFVGKTRHNFILLPSETYDVVLSATMLVPGLVNCNVFDVDASPLYFQPLCSVYTGMPKEAYIEEVVRQHSQAVGNTAEGTVTASHRTCEAVTRLRRGLHGEGKEKTHFFLDLIPLGFHRSQLVIEGRQELVFTNVVFAHTNDTQCRAAAEERIAKKREVYKKDYNAFEKNYSQFMELERIRLEEEGNFSTLLMESNNPNNNSVTASKLTAPTGGAFMEYIYRPPVQVSYVKSREKKDDAKPSNEKSVSPSGNDDDEEGIRQASTAEIQNDVKNISSPPNIIFAAEEEGFGLADKKKDKKGHSPLVHPNEPIVPLVAFSSSASKKVDTYAYTSMSPQEYFQRQRMEPHRLIAYEEGNNEVSKVSNVFLASNSSGTFSKSDAKGTSFPSDSSALRRATLLAPLAPPPATEGDAHVTGQSVLSPILGEARKTFVDIDDDDEEDERIGGLDDDNEDLKNSEEQAESSVRETIRPTMRSTTTKNNNLLDELFSDANQNSTLQDAVDLDLDDPLTPTVKAPVDNNNTNKALFSSVMTSTPVPLQSKETLTNNGKYYSNISKVKKSTFSSSSSSSGVD